MIWTTRSEIQLSNYWDRLVSYSVEREKARRAMQKAASMYEQMFGELLAAEKRCSDGTDVMFLVAGRLRPSLFLAEMRYYIRCLDVATWLPKDARTRSVRDILNFAVTSYVKAMTGRFHDGNVSGLLSEAYNSQDYTEVAQRMWRSRNYVRLEKHYAKLTRFAIGLTIALNSET